MIAFACMKAATPVYLSIYLSEKIKETLLQIAVCYRKCLKVGAFYFLEGEIKRLK